MNYMHCHKDFKHNNVCDYDSFLKIPFSIFFNIYLGTVFLNISSFACFLLNFDFFRLLFTACDFLLSIICGVSLNELESDLFSNVP